MPRLLVLNGPNLNLLGQREPEIYGSTGLKDIERLMHERLKGINWDLEFYQSNAEHKLVDKVQTLLSEDNCFVIINPAAFTHTSIALRDALLAVKVPFVEVHLSNVHSREEFRKKSWFSDIAIGTITGLGSEGYLLALEYLLKNHKTLGDTCGH